LVRSFLARRKNIYLCLSFLIQCGFISTNHCYGQKVEVNREAIKRVVSLLASFICLETMKMYQEHLICVVHGCLKIVPLFSWNEPFLRALHVTPHNFVSLSLSLPPSAVTRIPHIIIIIITTHHFFWFGCLLFRLWSRKIWRRKMPKNWRQSWKRWVLPLKLFEKVDREKTRYNERLYLRKLYCYDAHFVVVVACLFCPSPSIWGVSMEIVCPFGSIYWWGWSYIIGHTHLVACVNRVGEEREKERERVLYPI